jgi:hypothetical protein
MTILKEEVDITPYVERGLVGVNVDAVRDNINTFLNGVLGKCFITPYIALERVRKVLANFHIFLPRTTFLEGDRGVEVFDIKQFGEAMGMRNDGTVVTKMSDPYSLYFEYKMNDKGMFDVFAEIVTKDELDELMDAVNDDMDDDAEDDREDKLNESETKRLSPEEMEKIKAEYQRKKRESKQVEGPKSKYPSMKDIFEDSESVKMAGAETGPRRIAGQPDYGMAPDYEDTCEAKPKMKLVMKKKVNEGVIETIKRKLWKGKYKNELLTGKDKPDVAAIKKKRLTRFSQRRLSPPRVDEAAMDKDALAEGEVIQGKFPKDNKPKSDTGKPARVIKLRPNLFVHPKNPKPTETPQSGKDIKAKLRGPGRRENQHTGWMKELMDNPPEKKPSVLQKVTDYIKKKV